MAESESSGLEKRMFVDATQTFHYDTAQKVLKTSIVKISLSAESFYWNYRETGERVYNICILT